MSLVAAIQMVSGPDVAANLATAGRLLAAARNDGAQLIVLPENFAFMGPDDASRLAQAERFGSDGGPMQAFLAEQAGRLRCWIVGGTVPIATGQPDRIASACLVYDADGHCVARYDKMHLFDVEVPGGAESYVESASTCPGTEAVVVETPVGRLGLAVCYDLRFPELFRALIDRGAQGFALPAAFTATTGEAHWDVLIRARAIENLAFVVAAAQGGTHESGRRTFGASMVVDGWGRVLARLDKGEGIVTGAPDLDGQAATRQQFPALSHRVFRVQ